jgi:hypothetical protein
MLCERDMKHPSGWKDGKKPSDGVLEAVKRLAESKRKAKRLGVPLSKIVPVN